MPMFLNVVTAAAAIRLNYEMTSMKDEITNWMTEMSWHDYNSNLCIDAADTTDIVYTFPWLFSHQ